MTRFAALQTRLNNAQVKHLSDKTFLINAANVDGLFSASYADPFNVESSSPVFECKAEDVPGIVHGDHVTEGLTVYKVRNTQPYGTGMVRLILELQ